MYNNKMMSSFFFPTKLFFQITKSQAQEEVHNYTQAPKTLKFHYTRAQKTLKFQVSTLRLPFELLQYRCAASQQECWSDGPSGFSTLFMSFPNAAMRL